MNAKHIVAAIDFGPDTEKIIAYAAWLGDMAGPDASIRLVHVMDYALTPPAYMQPYIEEEKKENMAELEQCAVKLRGYRLSGKKNIECEVAFGRLAETFDMYLREKGTDIVVIGHKSHMLRASSSEKIIRTLKRAMLVVRGSKAQGASIGSVKIKRILCPTDFSANSSKALESAKSLAAAGGAELIALHVLSSTYLKSAGKKAPKDRERYLCETTSCAKDQLSGLLLDMNDQAARSLVLEGDPFNVIIETARDLDADLIVIGARGLSMLEGIFLGSVSEAVVKSSPCPVLIVHQ